MKSARGHAGVGDRETAIDLIEKRTLYEGFRRYTEFDFRENNHAAGAFPGEAGSPSGNAARQAFPGEVEAGSPSGNATRHEPGSGDTHEHDPIRREMLESHRTIAVLAFDRTTGDLVLINQFRIGAHLATGRGMLVEIVAGYVDEGEDAETAARRELTEETGLEALDMVKAAEFLPSPGMTTEFVTFFVARVDASALPTRAGLDADEKIFPFRCTLDEALQAADSFAISNVFTLFALNWFARNRSRFLQSDRAVSA